MFDAKTHNATRVTTLNTTVKLLIFVCVLLPLAAMAQLKVGKNTLLTIKSTLSTKEETNTFDSSALGNGEIYLVGDTQSLAFADNTSLPSLHIKNGDKIDIKTPLTINGNLIVESGTLHIQHDISLKGTLVLKNKAALQGKSFINKANYAALALDENAHSKILSDTTAVLTAQQVVRTIVLEQKGKTANHLHLVWQQFVIQPIKPPPENA